MRKKHFHKIKYWKIQVCDCMKKKINKLKNVKFSYVVVVCLLFLTAPLGKDITKKNVKAWNFYKIK